MMKTTMRSLLSPRPWAYLLFWSWNVVFVAFMALGFAPQMLPQLIAAVTAGVIPPIFLVIGVVLTLIPLAAIILALTALRRSPEGLFALAYGIEWPLMFMLAFRFFLLRDSTPPVAFIMSIALLGMATLLWQIIDRNIEARTMPLAILRAIGLTLLLVAYLYGSLWIAFYAVPAGFFAAQGFWQILQGIWQLIISFNWAEIFRFGFFAFMFGFLGSILFGFSATLFIITPIAVPVLAIRAWLRGIRALAAYSGAIRASALATAVVVASVVVIVLANQQPQPAAFALLKTPPATLAEARQISQQEGALRSGLLNTYLAQFRYISAVGQVQHVGELYKGVMRLDDSQAASVQQLYDMVARPLLYVPINPPKPNDRVEGRALREEPEEAAKLYKRYFDERIVDGEHDTIANTVRSTWSRDQAEAALQAVDDREVLLTRQEVNITEHGDWADIELYEVYQNQSTQRQEVVYYFSLPESAVVTGVWLGNREDRRTRFAYRVAPRGAAQAVYRNEVRRNVDPALVEQIGPRQYRLRVFPIEQRTLHQSRDGGLPTLTDGSKMHMWLTFRVLAHNNAWDMPRLAEKRNVYWSTTTTRLVNGKPFEAETQAWLPASFSAATPVKPASHRIDFPSGETVIARPMSVSELPQLPGNLRVAIVLDRSRSMTKYSKEAQAALARLGRLGDTDTFLTASAYRGEPASLVKLASLDTSRLEYLGGQNAGELLAQFDALRAGVTYDAIFVITDGSGYELGDSGIKVAIPNAPVWMIHLGGALPLGYDDATLEAIQASGGGVSANVEEALNRLAVSLSRNALAANDIPAGATADWVDGYAWYVFTRDTTAAGAPSDDFAPFAARRVILDAMYRQRANLRTLSTLDQLHAIAIKQSIVTPFSSMLVLVNSRQEELLKQLESRGDRFDREVEEVGETIPENNLSVTAVPEPHEWLLIGLAAAMLVWYVRRERSGRLKAEV